MSSLTLETPAVNPLLGDPEATYAGVHWQVVGLVNKFRAKFGGDQEELMSAAGLAYAKAYRTYSGKEYVDRQGMPHQTKFTTWVQWNVWYGLLDEWRARCGKRGGKKPTGERVSEAELPAHGRFDLGGWLDTLSPGARVLAELAVDPPAEVRVEAGHAGWRGLGRALERYLYDLGWANREVARASKEVWEALGQ